MPSRDNTFTSIGVLVVITQTIERLLNFLLTFVLQDGVPLTYSRLIELDTKNRRKTLGVFIRAMRERASFHDDIEMVLERFLESRNCLIHRFGEIPGSDLDTEDERQQLRDFLAQLLADTETLMAFCVALLHTWSMEIELPESLSIERYFPDEPDGFMKKVFSMAEGMDLLVFAKKEPTKKGEQDVRLENLKT